MLPASIALSVRCPRCRAPEGQPCVGRYGRAMRQTHETRRPAFLCQICQKPTGKRIATRFCQDCSDGRQDAQNRASNRKKTRAQALAHRAVAAAIKAGTLVRPKVCGHCGRERFCVAHHATYTAAFRLLVLWGCRSCHQKGHAAARPKRRAA